MKKAVKVLNIFLSAWQGSKLAGGLVAIISSIISGIFVYIGGKLYFLVSLIATLANIAKYNGYYPAEIIARYNAQAVGEFFLFSFVFTITMVIVYTIIIGSILSSMVTQGLVFAAHFVATKLSFKDLKKGKYAPTIINMVMGFLYMNYFGSTYMAALSFIAGALDMVATGKEPKQVEAK